MLKTSWDDYRIAYYVAKEGTLIKAGKKLRLNHATVLRHINQLEASLNVKLFIRHQRGYQLSEAGSILIKEFSFIEDQFNRLENRLVATETALNGNIRITTVSDYSEILTTALKTFRQRYPHLRLQVIATDEILSLSNGEADISLRLGAQPTGTDIIVKKLMTAEIDYYAHQSYVDEYGLPKNTSEYKEHLWVLPSEEKQHIPFVKEVIQHINREHIIYQSNNVPDLSDAVIAGIGIGPIAKHKAIQCKALHLVGVKRPLDENGVWFVYHKDLKASARIKALYEVLSQQLGSA